jgi:hypothetical protein
MAYTPDPKELRDKWKQRKDLTPFPVFDPNEMTQDRSKDKQRIQKASRINALGEVFRLATDLVGGAKGGSITPRNQGVQFSFDMLNNINQIDAENRKQLDYWRKFNIDQEQRNKQYQIDENRHMEKRDWQIEDREDQQKHSREVQEMIANRTLQNAQAKAMAEQEKERNKYRIFDEKTGKYITPDAADIRRLYNELVKNKGYSDFADSDPNLSNQLFDRYDNPDIEDQYQFVMKHWPSVRHVVFGVPQQEYKDIDYTPQIGNASKPQYQGPAPLSNEEVDRQRQQYIKDVQAIKNDPNLSTQEKRAMINELQRMSHFK